MIRENAKCAHLLPVVFKEYESSSRQLNYDNNYQEHTILKYLKEEKK